MSGSDAVYQGIANQGISTSHLKYVSVLKHDHTKYLWELGF
jgi:hypothetical protein